MAATNTDDSTGVAVETPNAEENDISEKERKKESGYNTR